MDFFLFAYIGPDQMMPLASALAAAAGAALIFWNKLVQYFRNFTSYFRRSNPSSGSKQVSSEKTS